MTESVLNCSFCGLGHEAVKKLIAGPGIYICNECVDLCYGIICQDMLKPKYDSEAVVGRIKQATDKFIKMATTASDKLCENINTVLEEAVKDQRAIEGYLNNRPAEESDKSADKLIDFVMALSTGMVDDLWETLCKAPSARPSGDDLRINARDLREAFAKIVQKEE